jgi:hypothetical protein
MRYLTLVLCFVVLMGCASIPPQIHNFEGTRTFDQDYDTSWGHVVAFFGRNNIPIKNLERDSGIVVAEEEMLYSPGAYVPPNGLDCGKPGGLAVPVGYQLNFNVVARKVGSRTEITINVFGKQARQIGGQPVYWSECLSTGYLERAILGAIGG